MTPSLTRRNIIAFLLFYCAALANGHAMSYVNEKYFHYSNSDNSFLEYPYIARALIIVGVAPIVETALLNQLPNAILTRLKVRNTALLIILPAILFALMHMYHPLYVVLGFVAGLILNGYYVYCQKHATEPFFPVALLHAAYNAYGFFLINS